MSWKGDPRSQRRVGMGWRNRDHTRGSIAVSLLVLALPSLASSLGGVAFQLTDLTFISRLGDAPMAPVVIVDQTLRQTFFMLLIGGGFGTQALIAGSFTVTTGTAIWMATGRWTRRAAQSNRE